jgi:hypothetical protein
MLHLHLRKVKRREEFAEQRMSSTNASRMPMANVFDDFNNTVPTT